MLGLSGSEQSRTGSRQAGVGQNSALAPGAQRPSCGGVRLCRREPEGLQLMRIFVRRPPSATVNGHRRGPHRMPRFRGEGVRGFSYRHTSSRYSPLNVSNRLTIVPTRHHPCFS